MDPAFTTLPGIVFVLAAATSLVLAGVGLGGRRRSRARWSFALGMLGFAAEAGASWMLLTGTEAPETRLVWLRAREITALLLLVPWGVFVASLGFGEGMRWPLGVRLGLATGTVLAAGAAAAVGQLPAFTVSDIPGPFYAVQIGAVGRWAVIFELLVTVAILGGLDLCLRASGHEGRWRIKYLVLGLGGVFLVRFFYLSQLLLFHVMLAAYLVAQAATLIVGNAAVAVSLVRDRLLGVELTVSRRMVYRSVVVGVLGLYLLTVGALGWLLDYMGIPEELLWGSLVVFVSAIGLAAILLSESIRWRIKRFIGLHFYRSKYDYREQWISYTKRVSSLLSVDDLAREVLGAVTEAAGAARGALYLRDPHGGGYLLVAAVEVDPAPAALDADDELLARLARAREPVPIDRPAPGLAGGGPPALAAQLGDGAVAVPLRWQGALTGVMLIGHERTGAPYSPEDMELFMTVGEQAAGAVVTARLSETLAQAREFEAFHRLTSFVIHDLKNSISALSLLSQNALANFDDREFQRDAITTLSRTVERMRALLARLSEPAEAVGPRLEPVDLAAVALEAVRPVSGGQAAILSKELAPVPLVTGDLDALLKVAQNLVGNAVEAVGRQGTVTVCTYEEGGWVVLAVSDTGPGMSKDFIQKSLFVPFRSTKKSGWGIGLYQAKGIVEAHRGLIEVASEEGKGTTFRVKLPAAAGGVEGPGA